jgi:hypothetical protein
MRTRAAVLTVLAGAALAVPATPAAAAACPQGRGVSVVVDFGSLGGGTARQCAAGDPASGVAALHAAGFTTTRAAQVPGYFVCRINGKPANDPCQRTSPADAYWSYWHARPGGSWTYSSTGPADYDPAPGTVEGWAFGAGKPPSSPPPSPAAPAPSATPSATRPVNPVPARTASARTPLALSPATTSPSRVTAASSPSPPAASPMSPPASPAAEPSTRPTRSTPGTVQSRPNAYAGPVVAGLLVLAIAAAGVRRLQLRRRADRG